MPSRVSKTVENFFKKSQEFSRSTWKLSVFPGVFQGPGRKFQKFQEFSRNSRSSEHHVNMHLTLIVNLFKMVGNRFSFSLSLNSP